MSSDIEDLFNSNGKDYGEGLFLVKPKSVEEARGWLYNSIEEYVDLLNSTDLVEGSAEAELLKNADIQEILKRVHKRLSSGQYHKDFIKRTIRHLSGHRAHFEVSVIYLFTIDSLIERKYLADVWPLLCAALYHSAVSVEKLAREPSIKRSEVKSLNGMNAKKAQNDGYTPAKFKAVELLIKSNKKFSKKSEAIAFILDDLSAFIVAEKINLTVGETEDGTTPLINWLNTHFRDENGIMAEAMKSVIQKNSL